MLSRYLFSIFVFLFGIIPAVKATHNRAGEIVYKRVEPFTEKVGNTTVQVYWYEITVIMYTNHGDNVADRCVDTIYFGDGKSGVAPRTYTPGSLNDCNCGNYGGAPVGCGSLIIDKAPYRVKQSFYTIRHQYPGPGNYTIRMFDPNRNENVRNIRNSVGQPFYIESQLIIRGFTGANSSPLFAFPPIDRACLGTCFEHNPGAYDPDGDSLSYKISTPRGQNGQTVLGYTDPETPVGGYFGIDPITGLLKWCHPLQLGEYNIAFIVEEWRKNSKGVYEQIGYVLRDMQVVVNACPFNQPPTVKGSDICVVAGTYVNQALTVSDPNNGNLVTVEGGGGPFNGPLPQANLFPTGAIIDTATKPSFTVGLTWETNCEHIRKQPYAATIKVNDNVTPHNLISFNTFMIRVVPPSVKGVTATPQGSSMLISWLPSTCNPTNNPLARYRVYRKNDCDSISFSPCQTGAPGNRGFQMIAEVTPTVTSYIDNNNGDGLVVGENYSYMLVAVYKDGTESFGSAQICSKLKRDIPVITNVDVISTSASAGSVHVKWIKPLTTPGNLDLSAFPGPYAFILKHRVAGGEFKEVFTSNDAVFNNLATEYIHSDINTQNDQHEYMVEFLSGTFTVGASQRAGSVFLTTTGGDRKMDLNWDFKTPWKNHTYNIYRKAPGASAFSLIATTTLTAYTDEDKVVNKKTYCYYVSTEGSYSDPSIPSPLINRSQEACAEPVDRIPPCAPTVTIDANCPSGFVQIGWEDLTLKKCGDDVINYEVYFKNTIDGDYERIYSGSSTSFAYDGLELISGCYAVRATDSTGNLGALSADFCIDNCPEFELPNVFSPNDDGTNDTYHAIKVRQVKEIDLSITDRWGNLVYQTNDPYFKWDGVSIKTKLEVSEGTFFYICHVYEPRLKGITRRTIKGYLHVVR